VGLLVRLHHVVADGIAALALIGSLLDSTPDARAPLAPSWVPRTTPGTRELVADNLAERAAAFARALSAFRRPSSAIRRLGSAAGQLRHILREGFTPRVSFNRPIGRRRRLLLVRADLDRASSVAHAHGAKVNDVVLAAVAGGARRLLEERGELKPGMVLKASVAASIRGPADDQAGGNRVGIVLAPLPVSEPDPIRRLEEITRATRKRKGQAPYQPSARFLQRWMVRAMFHQRLVNLFTSNLPGPPTSLYLGGARVLELFQVGVLQGNVTLGVGVLSYAGQLDFDIVGDAEAIPDLHLFADGLRKGLEELGVPTVGQKDDPWRTRPNLPQRIT
jgi:WS/DGAT/MGAT family acyltransferase